MSVTEWFASLRCVLINRYTFILSFGAYASILVSIICSKDDRRKKKAVKGSTAAIIIYKERRAYLFFRLRAMPNLKGMKDIFQNTNTNTNIFGSFQPFQIPRHGLNVPVHVPQSF